MPARAAELPRRASVVVIGGGVIGCSVAYHLARSGRSDVLLLERRQITSGTTWHAAGLLGQLRQSITMTNLARYTSELYGRLEKETGQPTGYRRCGSLSVTADPERFEELKRGASLAKVLGLQVEVVTAKTIGERVPLLETSDLLGGLHIPGDAHCVLTNVTSAMGVISLMGPASRALLQSLTPANLANEAFRFATSREIELGYGLVRASRITYVGELGWELYVPSEFVTGVYDEILAAGEAFGLVHAGYHALDSLRVEKAYRHWGHDITDQDSPLEAGLGFAVKFEKPGGFMGREALLRQKESGIAKRLIQFRLRDPRPLLYGNEPICLGDEIAGYVTSGNYGHSLGAAVGLGYVPMSLLPDFPELPNRFEIEVAGVRVPAEASIRPMYDPAGKRVRS